MMRLKYLALLLLALSTTSCAVNSQMRTGFYFLTDAKNGIKMKLEHSNEFFTLEQSPFASVDHVAVNYLETDKTDQGTNTELCLKFDPKGTKDIEAGTGNPLHKEIAVVVANKLLYVVENSTNIKTGVMCISVSDYSAGEIQAMQKAIANKK
jgi:hypothetical protein